MRAQYKGHKSGILAMGVDFTAPPTDTMKMEWLDINGNNIEDPIDYMDRRHAFRTHNARMLEAVDKLKEKATWNRPHRRPKPPA